LEDQAEILVEGNTLILRRPDKVPRQGWADDSKRLSACGDDALIWPEFSNEADADWTW
jgi:antitoxin MazE